VEVTALQNVYGEDHDNCGKVYISMTNFVIYRTEQNNQSRQNAAGEKRLLTIVAHCKKFSSVCVFLLVQLGRSLPVGIGYSADL